MNQFCAKIGDNIVLSCQLNGLWVRFLFRSRRATSLLMMLRGDGWVITCHGRKLLPNVNKRYLVERPYMLHGGAKGGNLSTCIRKSLMPFCCQIAIDDNYCYKAGATRARDFYLKYYTSTPSHSPPPPPPP